MPSQSSNFAMSALQEHARTGNVDGIARFFQSNPFVPQLILNDALASAASYGHGDAAGMLLSQGACITSNAFYGATSSASTAVFAAFLSYGWDINSTEFGTTALRLVRDDACIQWLLANGANPNI